MIALVLALSTSFAAPAAGPVHAPTPKVEASTYDPTRSLAPMIEAVSPAVIALDVQTRANVSRGLSRYVRGEVKDGSGSGFIVDASGLALTNWHVVIGAERITATLADGRTFPVEVLGGDESIDVALVQIKIDGTVPYAEISAKDDLRVGDWVVAIGNPLGLGMAVTTGIVSAKGRVLHHDVEFHSDEFIQTDAAINQGNSGGPLFDLQGRVVGMNTAIIQGANTIGFAIPGRVLARVLPDLKSDGRVIRGYLGIKPQTLDTTIAEAVGSPTTAGSLVAQVFDNTPASRGGLVTGDVIIAIDGSPVKNPGDLTREVAHRRPGDAFELELWRAGVQRRVRVVLEARPEPDIPKRNPASDDPQVDFGLGLAEINPEIAAATGLSKGCLVERVDPGGLADGRLRVGDLIVEINKAEINGPSDVLPALRGPEAHVLIVVRDGARHYVALPAR